VNESHVGVSLARKVLLSEAGHWVGRISSASFLRAVGVTRPVLALIALLIATALQATDLFPEETAFRAIYNTSRLVLKGRVVDPSGTALPECVVRLDGGQTGVTVRDGTFALPDLSRSNQLLTVMAPGYYREILPVQLFVPLAHTNLVLPPIVLWPETPSVVRFLFGGDTSFARRMLDPEERAARDQMPLENPDALIRVSDPLPGTMQVVGFVRPLFLAADYPVINLESVVTLDPATPHLQKDFVYFTLPSSLPALKSLNIDYVGLGNNHTYDYLESGVSNTCYHLAQAGLHYSGLGSNSAAAFAPYRTVIKDTPYSLLAMTSIGGEQHTTNYVAGPDKGGAAYIESTEESQRMIFGEKAAGYVTVVQPHVGDEYSFEPSPFALNWMKRTVDSGADLVICHHTHVAQGFGMYRGVLLVHCLGNLFFDQDRLETMVGMLATVDMDGARLRRAWGMPIYLEDYRPRPMSGTATPVLLRRISESSKQLRVFPYNGHAWVASRPSQYSFQDRRVVVPVVLGTNGWTALDLKEVASPEESLLRIETETPGLIVRLGRDLMNFGDFEDVDVDGEQGEIARWDHSTNAVVALQSPYRGTAALCLNRRSSNTTDAVASFRNRIRVMGDAYDTPNKDLTLFGYARGQSAGRLSIVARYYASEGTAEFGEELPLTHPGGTFGWSSFAEDLHMPPDDPSRLGNPPAVNPRAVRIFLHHSPPASGAGYAWFDELAVVNWEEALDPLDGPVLDTPHARDFLRVEGRPETGTFRLALTFRSYRPIEVDGGHGPDLALETEQLDQSVDHLCFRPTGVAFDDVLRLIVRNRGNEPLVLRNLTVAGGQQADFLARWLNPDGSPGTGLTLTVPPQAAGRLEVRFAPVGPGRREAVLQFQSNDPDEGQSVVNLAVSGDAWTNTPVRFLSGDRTLSPTAHLQVPAIVASSNLLREQLPAGVTPFNISNGGRWDAASRTLEWQDVSPRSTLSYSVTGLPGFYTLSGNLTSPGRLEATAGHTNLVILSPQDSDRDGLADWWELKFFDTRTNASAEVDSDGDGQNNRAEFLAETHPLDGGFQAQLFAPYLRHRGLHNQAAELEVLGSEHTSYRVEQSSDLQVWRPFSTNLLSGQVLLVPLTNAPGRNAVFYRGVIEDR
jgi:poly-gamma-glutamate capsule biosynthesis protein CapA/YwtB (metallophosphatase superfamily)